MIDTHYSTSTRISDNITKIVEGEQFGGFPCFQLANNYFDTITIFSYFQYSIL